MRTGWDSVFDDARPAAGASKAEIESFVSTVGQPLSVEEIAIVNRSQRNPFPESDPLHAQYRPFDPSAWKVPDRPLSRQYLDFLRWSNGGWCRTGDREFGFFPTNHPGGDVRAMMLGYHVPQYMPGALPFAFDGGGTFYLFDMRVPAVRGEYPVVCCHAGSLRWDDYLCWVIANSFEDACRGTENVHDLRERRRSTN
jgi:hypothetical protein